ncbi:sodium:proton antiporter [Arthrobacter agilis]|uniref:cation:proton antiporter n=1 Tax=Arthrobacter agilis TaxID=37921 RepID=UPI000B360020|nr:sodium:proton antiporter [Arthrobacter agilis]OUM43597.1 sodium:proton antiporter [Arthrobacter agilis]PPB46816.1 sodium:proton antiporter [Arthrobacter agilis]TPV24844.1 sodium:proton antiporter [Arthrobacter agilis]WDF33599.1 sodium:proton antiporter [Arthrobacter agilis]VDR30995.1 Sodium, potassium, lithium and rubidium/H(+) antiporter [Arthrobacter agilis]
MEPGLLGIIGITVLVAVAVLAKRVGVAAPLLLVVVGIGLSFVPGVPSFSIPDEWILGGILPPLLYAAAIKTPVTDFRRNLTPIASLSVALVVVSAFVTGLILHLLLPGLGLAAAIALGAVVSPPDAVAATSIGRRLGLPPRLLTVLEGEGLVNDATALVLLRSAVAASAGAMTGFGSVIGDFVFAVAAAALVGFAVGLVTVFVRSRLDDPVLDTAISFAVPFIAFVPAEELGASGVLAVVVAGLYTGHRSASHLDARARISDGVNWRTVQFLLENGVFLLIGLEIRGLLQNIDESLLSITDTVLIGLLTTLVLILLRFLWVFPLVLLMRRLPSRAERRSVQLRRGLGRLRRKRTLDARQERRQRALTRLYERRQADLELERREGFGWKGATVLGWSGMRGVVTLAAAQSLPSSFAYREQLVLIAFTVAVATLLLQGSTLPALIRLLRIEGIDAATDREESATLFDELRVEGLRVLDDAQSIVGEDVMVDDDVLDRVRADTGMRGEFEWEKARLPEQKLVRSPHRQYRDLRLAVLEAERQALLAARARGTYSSRVLARAQRIMDVEEARLRPRGGSS